MQKEWRITPDNPWFSIEAWPFNAKLAAQVAHGRSIHQESRLLPRPLQPHRPRLRWNDEFMIKFWFFRYWNVWILYWRCWILYWNVGFCIKSDEFCVEIMLDLYWKCWILQPNGSPPKRSSPHPPRTAAASRRATGCHRITRAFRRAGAFCY